MSADGYIAHVEKTLRQIEERIAAARRQLAETEGARQREALDRLAELQVRHDELKRRLEEARAAHAENWSALHESLREDADALFDGFEAWAMRHGAG
ncbi:MAG: hypothetical protein KatS3mg118_1750 [Paracoccaceae bacterium]|nr:MAG: hypothetical protein KatS3mg118_1750 [Paracoccaceae bacterium]